MPPLRILLYGYGNPGREDDGLGIAIADEIAREGIPGVTVEKNYQLNVEDALTVSEHDMVIFADASDNDIEFFRFSALHPDTEVNYTTHAMSPGSVLALCDQLYGKKTPAFLLEIKGVSWKMREGISGEARRNLHAASRFLKNILSAVEPIDTAASSAASRILV